MNLPIPHLPPTTRHPAAALLALVPDLGFATPSFLSPEDLACWRQDLDARLERLHQHPEQGLGFIEEHVRQCTLELQRHIVQRAMQAKADAVDENCPGCQRALIEKKRRVPKTIQSYCGAVQLSRTHGWCQTCEAWVFPADTALGLGEHSTASPLVQELCALLVSKMPCEQAEPVSARVAGIQFSRSTLAREAQRQGERAIQKRQEPITSPLQRCRKGKRRAVITERSYVATREGVEAMMRQLHAEAMRRGLASAQRVLVIADGAVWIWNAVQNRFSCA